MLSQLLSLIPKALQGAHSTTGVHPAYLLAAGSLGLAVYLAVNGDYVGAASSVISGLTAAGVIHVDPATLAQVVQPQGTPAQPPGQVPQ